MDAKQIMHKINQAKTTIQRSEQHMNDGYHEAANDAMVISIKMLAEIVEEVAARQNILEATGRNVSDE